MMGTARRFDAVILGGGHNGLTCAAYLAGAGLSVCVVERRECWRRCGHRRVPSRFRNSTASYR
jgi:2-polyprenyl-6-methoxyphenol hydroxylase-like FAD-dependent oxidoreductase